MEKQKKYVWLEKSKGPEDLSGFELRYLEPDTNGTSINKKFYTPSFGWWHSLADFMNGMEAAMRSATKKSLESEYGLVWLNSRPDDQKGCKLLGLGDEE